MLKVQIALIAILIVSVAFVSCERTQKMLEPVADDMMTGDDIMAGDDMPTDMMMDMMKMIDPSVYTSWAHVALPAPTMTVAEAAAAGDAAATGAAHNPGSDVFTSRTVYINDIGAMANKAEAATYPPGTIIVKAIMDETETAVDKVAVMVKSPDPMYVGHNGWMYAKYFLVDGMPELKAGSQVPGHEGNGCHGCHAKATNDSVFVSLSMDETPEMPEMPDAGETPEMPEMPDADAGDTNAAATNGGDATTDAGNGNENGNGAGNGNGNGNGDGDAQ